MNTQQIQATVNQNMNSAISLLYPVALMNHDPVLQRTFFDPQNGVALAGFRRQVANFGVMLVRAEYGRNNEVEVSKNDNRRMSGCYSYVDTDYIETNEGLLGSELKDGYREPVNNDIAIEKIDAIRNIVEARYEVDLSPNVFYRFIESRKRDLGDEAHRNKKFSMQFTAGLPTGHALATCEMTPDGIVMTTKVPKPGGFHIITSLVDRNSIVKGNKLQPGRVYLIQPMSYDQKTGVRTVNVLRTYKRGVRVAMQHFKMGLIRPGDKAYDVNPDPTNGIKERMVMDLPFMPSQDDRKIAAAPMLTFDLDMIYSLMKTLSGYPVVKMKFKDSSSGVYFYAEGNEYMPNIEAIVGPTIQYVRGRVWLP